MNPVPYPRSCQEPLRILHASERLRHAHGEFEKRDAHRIAASRLFSFQDRTGHGRGACVADIKLHRAGFTRGAARGARVLEPGRGRNASCTYAWLLRPQRPVVVEHGDALGLGDERRGVTRGDTFDKGHHCRFGFLAVVPGGKRGFAGPGPEQALIPNAATSIAMGRAVVGRCRRERHMNGPNAGQDLPDPGMTVPPVLRRVQPPATASDGSTTAQLWPSCLPAIVTVTDLGIHNPEPGRVHSVSGCGA